MICAHESGNPDAEYTQTLMPRLGPFGTHRALAVLVRFRDATETHHNFTGWPAGATQAPAFASGLLDPSANPSSFGDSMLTRYFYEQSLQPGGQSLIIYGDVYPEVIVTDSVEAAYYNVDLRQCAAAGSTCPPQQSGFGVLTKEVLDRIDAAGFDFGPYDQGGPNGVPDGVIDYLYIMVRGVPYSNGRRYSAEWDCFDPIPGNRHSSCGSLIT